MRHKKAKFFCENCGAEVPEMQKFVKNAENSLFQCAAPVAAKPENQKILKKAALFADMQLTPLKITVCMELKNISSIH